jgi:hypothetical protein
MTPAMARRASILLSRRVAASDVTLTVATAAAAGLLAALVLELWHADLGVPFAYSGDGNLYATFVKGILDHGWHYTNPSLGAPFGQHLYDFPIVSGENGQALLVKLLGLTSAGWATVMNLYFLLTFPLAAATCFPVLRRLGAGPGPASVCAILFALLPYHFAHGESELFISGYYGVPFGAYLTLSVLNGTPLFARSTRRRARLLAYATRRSLATVGMCLAVTLASGSFYYAAFTVILVTGATLIAWLARRKLQVLATGAAVVALVAVAVAANLTPSIVYRLDHGANPVVAKRGINESEIFALKLTELVLPIEHHRVGPLGRLSDRYAETAPFGDLGRGVHLGLVGSVAFLWLLVVALAGAAGTKLFGAARSYGDAATASLLAFLVGTTGGVSALIAAGLTPQFRAWNRITTFIAFFALYAAGMALTRLGERWHDRRLRVAFAAVLLFVVVGGTLDQTSSAFVPDYTSVRAAYRSDAMFVRTIENRLPDGASVFELPYVSFPEAGLGGENDYDLARPYLHSADLRWSFGAMAGRPEDWQARLATRPIAAVLPAVAAAGFDGICIDRVVRGGAGRSVERRVSALLEETPLLSADRRFSFFDLRNYHRRLIAAQGSAKLASLRAATLGPNAPPH